MIRYPVIDEDKAWPYIVTVAPASSPLTLDEIKTHLKISGSAEDTYLTLLLDAVVDFFEKYTKRNLITRTYETYRDTFDNDLEIRQSPSVSVSKIEYLVSDVLTTLSTDVYFLLVSNTFPRLSLKAGQEWPTGMDDREQAVKITFTAGYGAASDVPEDIKVALLQHIAALYENRGDCDESRVSGGQFTTAVKYLPVDAQLIYDMYRIRSI
jgi:uncharacterized phiE125 gp8 family phage protein